MKRNSGITEAIMDLKQAEQNFNYAATEFIEVAAIQLLAAEMKVDILLKLRKKNGSTPMDPWEKEKYLKKTFEIIVPQLEQTVKPIRRKIQIQINRMNYKDKPSIRAFASGKNF